MDGVKDIRVITSHKKASDQDIAEETWVQAGRAGAKEIKSEAGSEATFSRSLESMLSSRSDLIQIGSTFIRMFDPPEISSRFKAKLRTSSEIEELLTKDRPFNFVLSNIFNIIDNLFENIGFHYRVDTNLRDKGNVYGWERVDVIIEFPDEHYDDIDGNWRKVSAKISEFYKSLKNNPTFSEDTINHLREYIYVIIRSEE